jgi:hypothetical protein
MQIVDNQAQKLIKGLFALLKDLEGDFNLNGVDGSTAFRRIRAVEDMIRLAQAKEESDKNFRESMERNYIRMATSSDDTSSDDSPDSGRSPFAPPEKVG